MQHHRGMYGNKMGEQKSDEHVHSPLPSVVDSPKDKKYGMEEKLFFCWSLMAIVQKR